VASVAQSRSKAIKHCASGARFSTALPTSISLFETESAAIHATHGGRREILAKFWVNERGSQVLKTRAYRDGKSSVEICFSFVGGQIKGPSDFLDCVRAMPLASNQLA